MSSSRQKIFDKIHKEIPGIRHLLIFSKSGNIIKNDNRENMATMVDDRRVQLHRQGSGGRYLAEIIEEADDIVSAWLR